MIQNRENVCTQNKKKEKSQCDTNWLHPFFGERWNRKKTKQPKNKSSADHFRCDSSQWLRPVLAVPTALKRKEPRVREDENKTQNTRNQRRHVVEIYLFLLNVFKPRVEIWETL